MTNTASTSNLVSHTSIYFIGNLIRRVISFFMLPIYTRYLTTSDYGVIELLSTVIDFVGIMVGLRVAEGLFRFYSEYDNEREKNQVIITGLFLVALLNIIGILLVNIFSKPLSVLLFNSSDASTLLILYSFTLLGSALIEVPMAYLRAIQKPWAFIFFSSMHLAFQLSLNVYFVVFKNMRVEGVVYSAVISTTITSIILICYTIRRTGIHISSEKAKQLISFSWPLVITSMISFYIVFGDRYFLKFYHGLSEVGIYSLGYKFGFLISFIVNPFFNVWQTERYTIVKKENAEMILHSVMMVFSVIVISFVVILSVTIKDILRIMADPSFWIAYKIVPVILISYGIDAISSFTKLGILLHSKTKLFIYGNLIAAAVITVGYIVLIPRMGAMGAALATLCAYLVRFWWITTKSQKLYKLLIPWKQILIVSGLGMITFFVSLYGPNNISISVFFNFFLLLCFLISVFMLPIFPESFRKSFNRNLFFYKNKPL